MLSFIYQHRFGRLAVGAVSAVLSAGIVGAPTVSAATSASTGNVTARHAAFGQHVAQINNAFKSDSDGVLSIIVSLKDDPAVVGQSGKDRHFNAERDTVLARLNQRGQRGVKALDGAPFVSMEVTRGQFNALQSMAQVSDVNIDGVSFTEGTSYVGGAAGQQLTNGWDISQINATWTNANGYTGGGQAVAVIDSGVDKDNTYLRGRIVNEACFATNPDKTGACSNGSYAQYAATAAGVSGSAKWTGCTFDYYSCAHGTHVAQSAAGSYGVARGATIVAIRAGHKEWVAKYNAYKVLFTDSDILNSLWYVYAILPKSGIYVAGVNVSIGSDVTYASTCDAVNSSVTSYITALRNDYQIPTVIAAGNGDSSTGVSWPACISTAVAVGNSTLTATSGGIDAVFGGGSGGSNSSNLIDVLAPGTDICSAVPTWLKSSGWDCGWFGTSMAAPHVAGAMAVLSQKRPAATVTQMVAALQKSGSTGGVLVTDSRNNVTRTRINIANAVYYNI